MKPHFPYKARLGKKHPFLREGLGPLQTLAFGEDAEQQYIQFE